MAKKQTKRVVSKKTLQLWVKENQIKPAILEAVKVDRNLTNTTRLTYTEFQSILNGWLQQKVGGNNG
jgi:hypothetical protein